MENNKLHCDKGLLIGQNAWDTPVCVPLSAYLNFSHEMDVRLRRLVACWITPRRRSHAAPRSMRRTAASRGVDANLANRGIPPTLGASGVARCSPVARQ
jgi:hypothetical protein